MERPHRPRPRRAGFTLVELLVAILIIATLLALLLPTIGAAFKNAKQATVTTEMNNLATALASFRTQFGDFPPSRIILPEGGFKAVSPSGSGYAGASSSSSDISDTLLVQRSLTYLRKFWPRVNFNDPTAAPNNTAQKFFDFNGNGTNDGTLIINGSQCLTFFLGGIPILGPLDQTTKKYPILGVSGFSKSPVNPFINAAGATNRTAPNYEFVVGRLIDNDGNGIPSYLDPLDLSPGNRRAYAYFSAYGVNGYDPNDVNYLERQDITLVPQYEREDDPTDPTSSDTILVERGFLVSFPVLASGSTTAATYAVSSAPNPYTSGAPGATPVAWQNPNSYQILCAGADRQWGLGGTYIANAASGSSLPVSTSDPALTHKFDADDASPKSSVRLREADNLTNFSSSRLQ